MRHKENGTGRQDVAHEPTPKPPLPLKEHLLRRKSLIIIDDRHTWVKVLSMMLGESCDVPKDLGPTFTLRDAIALIDRHNPDIIVTDRQFDTDDKEAHLKVLDYAKRKNKAVKVLLFSAYLREGERGSAQNFFDGMIDKESPGMLIAAVGGF